MQKQIQEQILKAVGNGQLIRAIKLLRQVENIDLHSAKERIEQLSRQMQSGNINNPYTDQQREQQDLYVQPVSQQPRVHTHVPARQEQYNIEKELPTEAFLFLQKGEVKKAIKVIRDVKELNASSANHLVKTFYNNHPEYFTDEVEKFMRKRAPQTGIQKKKKSNPVFNLIFWAILIIIISNVFD